MKIPMFFQHILSFIVKGITRLLGLSSDCSKPGHEGSAYERHYFYSRFGPRIMIVRDGRVHRLTSWLTVTMRYDETDKLICCLPAYMLTKQGDKVLFGYDKVQAEYRRLRGDLPTTGGLICE